MIKTWLVISTALAVVFGGMLLTSIGVRVSSANPNQPNIQVIDNQITVVDQEPIYMPKTYKDKKISWQLPKDSLYKFDHDNGVKVAAEKTNGNVAFTDCKAEMDDLRFTCKNDGTTGWYKYTIKVTGPGTIPDLDPWIRNG